MYSPLNTHSKQLLLDDPNTSENHIDEEISGKKVAQDDFNQVSKKKPFKMSVEEEEKSTTMNSEISSVIESDSDLSDSNLTHDQMKEERNKKIT
jgi:hypothetical protein